MREEITKDDLIHIVYDGSKSNLDKVRLLCRLLGLKEHEETGTQSIMDANLTAPFPEINWTPAEEYETGMHD